MTIATNLPLQTDIQGSNVSAELTLEMLNDATVAAIEEGHRLLAESSAPRYSIMNDLKAALDL